MAQGGPTPPLGPQERTELIARTTNTMGFKSKKFRCLRFRVLLRQVTFPKPGRTILVLRSSSNWPRVSSEREGPEDVILFDDFWSYSFIKILLFCKHFVSARGEARVNAWRTCFVCYFFFFEIIKRVPARNLRILTTSGNARIRLPNYIVMSSFFLWRFFFRRALN